MVIRVNPQPVRDAEQTFAPGTDILALRIEDDNGVGVRAALGHVNVASRVHGDGRNPAEPPAVGQRVRFLAEADHDPVFEQPAFMRIPALLRRARGGQENRE